MEGRDGSPVLIICKWNRPFEWRQLIGKLVDSGTAYEWVFCKNSLLTIPDFPCNPFEDEREWTFNTMEPLLSGFSAWPLIQSTNDRCFKYQLTRCIPSLLFLPVHKNLNNLNINCLIELRIAEGILANDSQYTGIFSSTALVSIILPPRDSQL